MKVTITKDIESGTAVEIHCREVTSETERLERYISRFDGHVLQTEKRLYELEELLDEKTFFRASKSVIVNLNKITKLKPEVTRNILATLTNGEVIVISRRNVKALKELIGVEG